MKKNTTIILAVVCLLGTACGSDDPPLTDISVFPVLGTQIDRMGRAGVATALIGAFDPTESSRSALKDMYSQDSDMANWVTRYADGIANHLAVLDAVDSALGASGCGNQFNPGNLYTDLAGALADDRLLIDSSQATCTQYLALEASVANDCGGRTPAMDSIGVTYAAVANVALFSPTGVDHGPDDDADGAPSAAFPYLTTPN